MPQLFHRLRMLVVLPFALGMLPSCFNSRELSIEEVAGNYVYPNYWDSGAKMNLRPDSTFTYTWWAGLMDGTTHGTWKIDQRSVVLNSEYQPEQGPYRLLRYRQSTQKPNGLRVHLVDRKGENAIFVNCELKSGSEVLFSTQTNLDGRADFPALEADSLVVSFLGFGTIRFPITDPSVDYYQFELVEGGDRYAYFTNTTWRVKRNRLIDPTKQKSRLAPKPYFVREKEQ